MNELEELFSQTGKKLHVTAITHSSKSSVNVMLISMSVSVSLFKCENMNSRMIIMIPSSLTIVLRGDIIIQDNRDGLEVDLCSSCRL